jgi:hypothetical protein
MKKGNYKLGSHHDLDSNILLPAMYRIEADGKDKYLFLIDREVGLELLDQPKKIESLYRRDMILIYTFFVIPASVIILAMIMTPILHAMGIIK